MVDLLELYDLQLIYLRSALARGRWAGARRFAPEGEGPSLEGVFGEVVRLAGNAVLTRANHLLADRLAAPRLAERQVFDHLDAELARLEAAQDTQDMLKAIEAYQGVRVSSGPAIISALRAMSASPTI